MSTCLDCYNQFICMDKNKSKYKQCMDNETTCKEYEPSWECDIIEELD